MPRRLSSVSALSLLALFLLGPGCSVDDNNLIDSGPRSDAGPVRDASLDPGFDAGTDAGVDAGTDAGTAMCAATAGEVVTFTTEDGVTLEADLYVPATPSGAAAYLFHMIPPSNDRTNYPASFISALTDRGFVVLNVDRRGAGGSGGVATEAYTGPNGKLDVRAAVDFLAAHPCAPDRFVLVGASNGTTSVLDYTIFAASEPTAALPAGLVFLTGGGYTENQNMISANRAVLDPLPIDFVFSTAERAWSESHRDTASAAWMFDERTGGAHGTGMFEAVPATVSDVADWMQAQITP